MNEDEIRYLVHNAVGYLELNPLGAQSDAFESAQRILHENPSYSASGALVVFAAMGYLGSGFSPEDTIELVSRGIREIRAM